MFYFVRFLKKKKQVYVQLLLKLQSLRDGETVFHQTNDRATCIIGLMKAPELPWLHIFCLDSNRFFLSVSRKREGEREIDRQSERI